MYRVELARAAERDLDGIRARDLSRLRRDILGLATQPRPNGVKRLQGMFHRIRVGDWRVIYAIEDQAHTVVILRVLRRNERTYRWL